MKHNLHLKLYMKWLIKLVGIGTARLLDVFVILYREVEPGPAGDFFSMFTGPVDNDVILSRGHQLHSPTTYLLWCNLTWLLWRSRQNTDQPGSFPGPWGRQKICKTIQPFTYLYNPPNCIINCLLFKIGHTRLKYLEIQSCLTTQSSTCGFIVSLES